MSKGGGNSMGYYPPIIQKETVNTQQSSAPAKWIEDAGQSAVGFGQHLIDTAGQPYTGQLTAGMNADQLAAGEGIRRSVGAYLPVFDRAGAMTLASAAPIQEQSFANSLAGGGLNQYLSPYMNYVASNAMQLGDQQLKNNLNTIRDGAIHSGAAFGSRHAVQEGAAAEANANDVRNYISQQLQGGFACDVVEKAGEGKEPHISRNSGFVRLRHFSCRFIG